MAKINNINDFNNLTSNITSFSHAYLFNTNSLPLAYDCAKLFAKRIICSYCFDCNCTKDCSICYQIDQNEYDDFYVINPDSIGINTEEIEKLFEYMKTKSVHDNGKRVYVIYGFERLSRNVSNKILKFLEEPVDNLYAILITENLDEILSTIISRCQVFDFYFDNEVYDDNLISKMDKFLLKIEKCRCSTIAFCNDYFEDIILDRIKLYNAFLCLENILSDILSKKINKTNLDNDIFHNVPLNIIIKILEITTKRKQLIRKNINLNLLIDRYIIEVSKELDYAKDCRN